MTRIIHDLAPLIQDVPETASDERQHILDGTCWCRPIHDPQDSRRLVHRSVVEDWLPIPKSTPRVKEPRPLRSRPKPVNEHAKAETFRRDDYLCQWCRVAGGHLDAHHRLRRSQGGQDRPEHMVSVHRLCHSYLHDNPREASERGFLVPAEDDLRRGWW